MKCFATGGVVFHEAQACIILYFKRKDNCNRMCMKVTDDSISPFVVTKKNTENEQEIQEISELKFFGIT